MKFFEGKAKKSTDSYVRFDNRRAVLDSLAAMFKEAVGDLNASLQDDALKVRVSKAVKTQEVTDTGPQEVLRLLVRNVNHGLSIRSKSIDTVEVFMLPASQLALIPQTEYPSRLKFKLTRHEENEWRVDGRSLTESELRLLVLTATNDLLKYSSGGGSPFTAGARIRIGALSLTTGLRDLLFEKEQLVSALVTQQEKLQSQLAGDLHDSVIADLLFLAREVTDRRDIPPENICGAIHSVVGNLREICANLSSREIRDWGLTHALNELALRFRDRGGKEITTSIAELPFELPYEAALQIYRIAQEVLNNALKHSQCSNIRLTLSCSPTDLLLTIEDDGVGFSSVAMKGTGGSGMGIPLLKERTDMLTVLGMQSALLIDSQPGAGTKTVLQMDISQLSR